MIPVRRGISVNRRQFSLLLRVNGVTPCRPVSYCDELQQR